MTKSVYRLENRPPSALKITDKASGAYVYIWTGGVQFSAMGALPSSKINAVFSYRFKTEKAREEYVKGFFASQQARKKSSDNYKGRYTNETVNIGDIFYTTWGWDETHHSFYQVIEKVGDASAKVCEIGHRLETDGCDSGRQTAIPGQFKMGEATLHRVKVRANGEITLKIGRHVADKDDGRPHSCTWGR